MSFWDEKTVTARKPHRCDECDTMIQPGERYTRGAGINVFGEFGVYTTHTDCLAAAREQMRLGDCPSDEWWCLSDGIWEMDADGLAAFALDFPAVFERFRPRLEQHDLEPIDHFVWRGPNPHYVPARRDWYRWEPA